MSRKVIDILEPYEDEVLFSWIVRMLNFYSCDDKLSYKIQLIMFDLFGPDSSQFPGLFYQRGLDYFVENCQMPNSFFFHSKETMIEKMTVLPFYKLFLTREQNKRINQKLSNFIIYRELEELLRIKTSHRFMEGGMFIKYCPRCINKEPRKLYLQKEHQVQGNFMCWKHQCEIKRLPYKLDWNAMNFYEHVLNGEGETYNLSEKECNTGIIIAGMIHEIFLNGFQDSITELKRKLQQKMHDEGILDERHEFLDLEGFLRDFQRDAYFRHVFKEKEILRAIYSKESCSTPITYLLLIEYLFGGLGAYYLYSRNNFELNYKSDICLNERWKKNKTILYYEQTMGEEFFETYCILGDTESSIVVRHLVCGTIYKVSKKMKKLQGCPVCGDKRIEKNRILSFSKFEAIKCHYLSTRKYGELYNKKEKQIRNYCNDNRIPGAIYASGNWLVPENAPYPTRKRLKNNI